MATRRASPLARGFCSDTLATGRDITRRIGGARIEAVRSEHRLDEPPTLADHQRGSAYRVTTSLLSVLRWGGDVSGRATRSSWRSSGERVRPAEQRSSLRPRSNWCRSASLRGAQRPRPPPVPEAPLQMYVCHSGGQPGRVSGAGSAAGGRPVTARCTRRGPGRARESRPSDTRRDCARTPFGQIVNTR